jgi:hypothetical protein
MLGKAKLTNLSLAIIANANIFGFNFTLDNMLRGAASDIVRGTIT